MTVNDTTARDQTDAIAFEIELRHAPEKVWRALTDPVLLSEWLLPAVGLTLEVGSPFRLSAPPLPEWDGTVNCRVLEIDPGRKLRYSWVVGEGFLDTVVTFTLAATATGTRLTIVQSGFREDQKKNFGGARYGWRLMGSRLIDVLARLT
jgi:uncharacterized protein YndB with AHSA1/START domain